MAISDWTERHRPSNERSLEGNEDKRKVIRAWLEEWKVGKPTKPGILLIGPPGVGKTTVARAVAKDMGWNVIELNASDARNAAAIRKAATHAATHGSLFQNPGETPPKTLILLDEVDHLSGGLRSVNQDRVKSIVMGDQNSTVKEFKGDSGGKAELLNLLKSTKQPVILACNEEMGLWGRTSSRWRDTRDRFTKYVKPIRFGRVSTEALRRITLRVLKEEGFTADPGAIDLLVENNPGDLRALVRDLQVMCSICDGNIDRELVIDTIDVGTRDQSIDIFPGLGELYKSRTAEKARSTGMKLDKSPDEMVAWISWNNVNVMTEYNSVRRGSKALSLADNLLTSKYRNTAHRSWYWGSNLSTLGASVVSDKPLEGKVFCSRPSFLGFGSAWRRKSIIERLASTCGSSKKTVREELLPSLLSIMDDNGEDFTISLSLGLSPEEHAAISGLKISHRSTKDLLERYSNKLEDLADNLAVNDEDVEINTEIETEEVADSSNQMKLF
ncbi:MAG: AAA family ATPase [Candidatus Poseidoniaceae archaeon]|jgi:replication factor C large subunit|nr:AAA family ATPase [Candidatus Poseidoniaceae archaeon]